MRSWLRILPIAFAALALGALFVPWGPAESQPVAGDMYFSLESAPPAPGVLDLQQTGIPPDGSTWHELYPSFCGTAVQDGYHDNGDGVVSACDEIVLNGATWHIKWTGPTYYLTCFDPTGGTSDVIWEPNLMPHDPGNPACEGWHEVWPQFCFEHHIDDWNDSDGTGSITPCDDLFSGGLRYHVEDIRLNIIIEPVGTPTEDSSWGKVKQFFNRLF